MIRQSCHILVSLDWRTHAAMLEVVVVLYEYAFICPKIDTFGKALSESRTAVQRLLAGTKYRSVSKPSRDRKISIDYFSI